MDSRDLGEVATAAVPVARILDDARVTIELMLERCQQVPKN